jgi:fructokinase
MITLRIGIDLGGSKTELVAIDASGRTCASLRWPTPHGDYAASVAAIARRVAAVEVETGLSGTVGVGIPGTLSPASGLVRNANSTWLNGRPLDCDLAAALGRPVRVANDANCFALSEAVDGAGAGAAVVFGVILGTGVGGGIVVDGRPLIGRNAIAGEWGHTPLPGTPGDGLVPRRCWCGRDDCIETYLSGPGLARTHSELGGDGAEPARLPELAATGDGAAQAALDLHADQLARSLAVVVDILDPDVIVLGGGLSNLPDLAERVAARWSRFIFSDRIDTLIRRHAHGDASGVRGAAWLWQDGVWDAPQPDPKRRDG